jgi:hypothetical protein
MILDEPQTTTPEEHAYRISVCKTCDQFHVNEDYTTTCLACGCSCSLLLTYQAEICPLNKW